MENALETLARFRIVPVITIDEAATANALGDALVAGGLGCAEITLRTPAALKAITALARRADFIVGAGTVITVSDVDRAVEAGATFLVSPGLNESTVERASQLNVPIIPGIATATELQNALALGLETVKVFPVEQLGGVNLLRSFSAVFPNIRFMPSGGVRRDNVSEYLNINSVLAVGGSWMATRATLLSHDFAAIRASASDAHDVVATEVSGAAGQ